jgi:hypothetical protein
MEGLAVRALALCLILLTALRGQSAAQSDQGDCGYDRWPVKIMRDGDRGHVVLQPQTVTVADLSRIPIPEIPYPRERRIAPQELTTYRVRAIVQQILVESDRDWHIVLSHPDSASLTMIAEIPDPACAGDSGLKRVFAAARDSLRAVPRRGEVWVTGVGFFDFIHTQRGRAPNAFELHPVLRITRQIPKDSLPVVLH